jgi:hypothetical protein
MKLKPISGILIIILLILSNSPASPAMAQAPTEGHLRLLSSDAQAALLELTVADFSIETVEHQGQTYHRLIIPDMAQTETPGEPQVPTRGTLLGLPSTDGVSVEVVDADYETLNGYRLHPAPRLEMPGDNLDDPLAGEIQPIFALNQELYATDAFYPGAPVEIGHTGYIRDQAVAQVGFYPVQYNPVAGEVRLYRRIVARVTWDTPLSITTAETPDSASPAFETMLRKTLLNYDALRRPPVTGKPLPPFETNDIVAADTTPALKIGITQDGLYQLTPGDLTGAGFNLTGVALDTIKINNQGVEVRIYVHDDNSNNAFDGDDYILFYGTAINDVYTNQNVYWLTAGGALGLRMGTRDGTPSGGTVPTHFPATLHVEEDTYYWQFMPNGEGKDHWFWGSKLNAPESRDYTLNLNNISTTAGTATVRVRLEGYTAPNHHTKIYLNDLTAGNEIDDQTWSGQITYDHEVTTVPHSDLQNGSNTVRVEAADTALNQFFVNWIELEYWDTYVAENDELLFGPPEGGTFQFEVTGFSSGNVDVYDVTNPANVVRLINVNPLVNGVQFQEAAQPQTRCLALTTARRKSPASIELDSPSSWGSTSHGADYIIITHEDFYSSVQPLASHRSASGLRVVTVKVEDIYDEFNYGIFNPQAIRDFLSYAYHNWVDPAPAYVLLVGDAHYDYKDNLGTGTMNYVPSQIIQDSFGQTISDNWFVLVSGSDILPDMFIGRLTAQTASEATDMVSKIIYYDQHPPGVSWNKKVLLVADDGSAGDGYTYAFEIASDQFAASLPYYYTANKIYVRYYPPGDPTTDITDHINNGSLLVNYSGHGNVKWWGAWTGGSIFERSHVNALSNTNKLPVVTLADCLNGYFVGTETSMAEAFLRRPDQRAVAIWAATSLGYASGHQALIGSFYDAIFQDNVYELGAATWQAKIENPSQGELIETFVLFGDPAMELGIPPYVESTTPANGARDVPLDQNIQIVFSRSMNPATVQLSGPGTAGLGFTPAWNPDKTVLTYTHTPDFVDNQTLTFTISGQDNLGNSLGTGGVPATWTFSTPTAPSDVAISGPTTGLVAYEHSFTAAVNPSTTTEPLTYEWRATGHDDPVTHTGGGLSDTIAFSWSTTGTQVITVTATNALDMVTNTHTITISDNAATYLPIVTRNN